MMEENFETGLARLEAIGRQMEEEDNLEVSLKLYKEAKLLAEKLEARLDQAELTIRELSVRDLPAASSEKREADWKEEG